MQLKTTLKLRKSKLDLRKRSVSYEWKNVENRNKINE
jgi:hypothetical protein